MKKDAMDGGMGKSPRKAMASGETGGGNFGVESFEAANGCTSKNADAGMGRKTHMEDGARAIGMPVHHTKGHHPAQAAPDHGPTHTGGQGMEHYVGKA